MSAGAALESGYAVAGDRLARLSLNTVGLGKREWSEWAGGMTITVASEGEGSPVTTLTGTVDQAALQGLLRRLYSLGLPLISAICVACD